MNPSYPDSHPDSRKQTGSGTRPITRRTFLKKAALWAGGMLLLPPAGFGYARWIEPGWIDTVRIDVPVPRLPEALDGLRIAHFSDLHLGFHLDAQKLSSIVAALHRLQPELVCFTGDWVDYAVSAAEAAAAVQALSQLNAPLGKFAVLGNHDYYAGQPEAIADLLGRCGFRVLRNEAVRLDRNGAAWSIAGVEDQWAGKPDLQKALRGIPGGEWTLLLSHCPDFADIALAHDVDLQLSGHSHGGQIRLPGYGPLFTPAYGSKYVSGLYKLGEGKLQVYVNRGIGVSVYPVRFACRPELTLMTLRRNAANPPRVG